MEPVIVGAVVTVAVSVVNGIVKITRWLLNTSVERARISETAQTDRIRCLTGHRSWPPPLGALAVEAGPADRAGGEERGGRTQR